MPSTEDVPGRIRLYLVDGLELFRHGVIRLVEDEPDIEVVGQTGSAKVALGEIRALRPDVVLIDAQLPDGGGIDLCGDMRRDDPSIRGLVLASDNDPDVIAAAIHAGVAGYVLRRIEGSALLNGIRLIAAGHSLIDPAVVDSILQRIEAQRAALDVLADLTAQQRKIFLLISEGLTNREIGERLHLAEKTVKNHVTGLLARLGLRHRTQVALLGARLADAGRPEPGAPGTPRAFQAASEHSPPRRARAGA
ncbi:response regulator transcription factor [Nocardioides albidus]|uniref:Response regulator transcription factor n=1 Tax=Nocardioides albidus TaxID=1517589 RepID=A0A5C4W965_9ACTN|nr:response regulator transcription factor [Nocardioides albidus]TNM44156.1 response regulator transcription factor [Nocardioides albidus]